MTENEENIQSEAYSKSKKIKLENTNCEHLLNCFIYNKNKQIGVKI